jgi:hypothetical protein
MPTTESLAKLQCLLTLGDFDTDATVLCIRFLVL